MTTESIISKLPEKSNRSSSAITKLTQAEKWLAEAKSLDELKNIHDIAVAAEAYALAHKLSLEAVNHATEIRLTAARRMGEISPPHQGKQTSPNYGEVTHQRLSEYRKLARIAGVKHSEAR